MTNDEHIENFKSKYVKDDITQEEDHDDGKKWKNSKLHRSGDVRAEELPVVNKNSSDWFYRDPQGNPQGPFSKEQMREWWNSGFFSLTLPIRCQGDVNYAPIGAWFADNKSAFLEVVPIHLESEYSSFKTAPIPLPPMPVPNVVSQSINTNPSIDNNNQSWTPFGQNLNLMPKQSFLNRPGPFQPESNSQIPSLQSNSLSNQNSMVSPLVALQHQQQHHLMMNRPQQGMLPQHMQFPMAQLNQMQMGQLTPQQQYILLQQQQQQLLQQMSAFQISQQAPLPNSVFAPTFSAPLSNPVQAQPNLMQQQQNLQSLLNSSVPLATPNPVPAPIVNADVDIPVTTLLPSSQEVPAPIGAPKSAWAKLPVAATVEAEVTSQPVKGWSKPIPAVVAPAEIVIKSISVTNVPLAAVDNVLLEKPTPVEKLAPVEKPVPVVQEPVKAHIVAKPAPWINVKTNKTSLAQIQQTESVESLAEEQKRIAEETARAQQEVQNKVWKTVTNVEPEVSTVETPIVSSNKDVKPVKNEVKPKVQQAAVVAPKVATKQQVEPAAWNAGSSRTKSLREIQEEELRNSTVLEAENKVKLVEAAKTASKSVWSVSSNTQVKTDLRSIQEQEINQSKESSNVPIVAKTAAQLVAGQRYVVPPSNISSVVKTAEVAWKPVSNAAPKPVPTKAASPIIDPKSDDLFWGSSKSEPVAVVSKPAESIKAQPIKATTPVKPAFEMTNKTTNSGNAFGGPTLSREMESWCKVEMAKLTGNDDTTLVSFLMTLDDTTQVKEYCEAYLGSSPAVDKFCESFITQRDFFLPKVGAANNLTTVPIKKKKGKGQE